jgi:Protein of unknown function (DUF3303)
MVVERFTTGARPVYARASERGRMLPDGLRFIDSWIVDDGAYTTCFQLMETEDPSLFQTWMDAWRDLTHFEIHPVIDSTEVMRRLGM